MTELPKTAISFSDLTMTGGKKTAAGKDRILPIHPFIQEFVHYFYSQSGSYFFTSGTTPLSYSTAAVFFPPVIVRSEKEIAVLGSSVSSVALHPVYK